MEELEILKYLCEAQNTELILPFLIGIVIGRLVKFTRNKIAKSEGTQD